MIILIIAGIILLLGIALYTIPGMIIHDKIYFAVIDDEKEKAMRLYTRYKWLIKKSDREDLKKHMMEDNTVEKENDGN